MKFVLTFALALPALVGAAQGGRTVTAADELLSCLGNNGTPNVAFCLDAEVIRGCSPHVRAFIAKANDTYLPLQEKSYHVNPTFSAGDLVHVCGQTAESNGFVTAECQDIRIIGHRESEPALKCTIGEVLCGDLPFRLLRVSGKVIDAFVDEIDTSYEHVIISSGDGSLGLSIPVGTAAAGRPRQLVGAEISAVGVFMPFRNGFRRFFGTELNLQSHDDITVLKLPPADPFDVPAIRHLRHPNAVSIAALGRHRATGNVIAVWQGNNFLLKSDDGILVNVSLSTDPVPSCGESVEVAGLPGTDLYHLNLRRAIWRKRSGEVAQHEAPIRIRAKDLFGHQNGNSEIHPAYHGKTVVISGTVITTPMPQTAERVMRIKCDDFVMPVDSSASPDAFARVNVGCLVDITGTCIVKTDSWHPNEPLPRIREIVLAVRTPDDVTILSAPPWWTPGRLFAVIGTLLAFMLAILLWNGLLRCVAERRGRELAQEKVDRLESLLKVQERTRIAVELHDSLAQNLTGVSLEIDSAEQLSGKNPAGMLAHLRIAARTLQSCRNELRNCLWDLRSRALEEQDLNEAIRRAIAPQVTDIDLSIRFNIPRKRLSDDMTHVLMRIIRELVINAVRHGQATTVKIAGSDDGNRLLFSVRDNGSGFDPDNCPGVLQGHFGLQGIQERINQFNGEMKIDSAPGNGTHVTIALDMPATSPAATNAL